MKEGDPSVINLNIAAANSIAHVDPSNIITTGETTKVDETAQDMSSMIKGSSENVPGEIEINLLPEEKDLDVVPEETEYNPIIDIPI